MNYSIYPTSSFQVDAKALAKKYHSFKDDLATFIKELKVNPFIGADLGNNTRKIRLAITAKNKGKSGGARVITYNLVINIEQTEVYLLAIYDKGERGSISKKEIMLLKQQNEL